MSNADNTTNGGGKTDPSLKPAEKQVVLKIVVEQSFVATGMVKPGSRASRYYCSKIAILGSDNLIAQECLIPEAMIKQLRHGYAMQGGGSRSTKALHEKLVEWAMFNVPSIGIGDLKKGIITPGDIVQ